MEKRINVNLVGNQTDDITSLENALRDNNNIETYFYSEISDYVSDAKNFSNPRSITILNLTTDWQETLDNIKQYSNLTNGSLLVVGPENTQAMRATLRLNAHDYFSNPINTTEISEAIEELTQKLSKSNVEETKPQVATIINTEGGSGSSFIATNIAHLLATAHLQKVALLDMDVQFGSQSLNLDLAQQYGISDVLSSIGKLDSIALPSYMAKHKSGVHVLGEKLEDIVIPSEIPPENIEKLITLCSQTFTHTIIDLPRQIDSLFATVVTKSDRVVLVMQQTLAHVRDTKRLLTILTQEFEVPKNQITLIVNRHDEKHAISKKDIENTVGHPTAFILPNDYERAVKATELAKPFVDSAPNTPLAKGLQELSLKILGDNHPKKANTPAEKFSWGGLFGGKK